MTPKILIATGNEGKVRELRRLLGRTPLELLGLKDIPVHVEVAETGETFRENALIKASAYARLSGMMALADDSGLEVSALGGEPGVRSARFGGDCGYDDKMSQLLHLMTLSGTTDRTARFVCAMTLCDAGGRELFTAEGTCSGIIAEAPRGTGGFGYDPVFIPEGYDRTFAELPPDVKHDISHRARAASQIIRYLLDFIVV